MNLAGMFGDDEHTAHEGAYPRAMKARKWLVLAAAAFFVVHDGRFLPKAFGILVGTLDLPLWIWDNLTAAGLAYSSAMYLLLLFQLAFVYPRALSERFALRNDNEFKERLDALKAIDAEIFALGNSKRAQTSEMHALLIERRQQASERLSAYAVSRQAHPLAIVAEVIIDIARLFSPWGAFAIAMLAK